MMPFRRGDRLSVERSELKVESSAPRGAVILSYAREDTAAAQRIADALRPNVEVGSTRANCAAGVWDANRAIKLALFVRSLRRTRRHGPRIFRLGGGW